MITSIALVLLGAATAATPCEKLATMNIANATITSATVVPEGPPAPRGGGGGRGGGGQRGGAAPAVTGQLGDVLTVPRGGAPALPPAANAAAAPAAGGQRGAG